MNTDRFEDKRIILNLEEAGFQLKFKLVAYLRGLLDQGRITEEEYKEAIESFELKNYLVEH